MCDGRRYNEQEGYSEYVMLIYDGLHYDALAVSAFEGAPEDMDITVMQVRDAAVHDVQKSAQPLGQCVCKE
jgi:ubiquitin thioesterase OTU1